MTRLLLVPSVFAALVGCADGDASRDVLQLGTQVASVPVAGERTTTARTDWKVIEQKLSDLKLTQAGILDFYPLSGTYKVTDTLVHIDDCGIEASGFRPIDHGVRNVNKRSGVYLTDYIDRDNGGEVFDTMGCELNGHTYRCDASEAVYDFSGFGLDAVVTIQNDDFGNWSASTDAFIGINPFSVTCKGADCGEEPAASLFGFISNPMPCTGLEGQRIILEQ